MKPPVRLFTRSDVERLLNANACIAAVENAFRLKGLGHSSPAGALGVHVPGGGFHAKAAFLVLSRPYFVVKVNANFPQNPAARALPTIQGVLALFDATNGVPLALMDSMSVTMLRTAAASAVAVKFLAGADAHSLAIIGCGVQGRAHVESISHVRELNRVFLFDVNPQHAVRLAAELRRIYAFEIVVVEDFGAATRERDIVVTTTSSIRAFLDVEHISAGTFIAAVGADSEHKHELSPALLQMSAVVVDDLEQCATIGDLHHAISAGIVTRTDVRAALHEVVAGVKSGRTRDDEIIVFDSTGIAMEDVAAAALVYEKSELEGIGTTFSFEN